MDGSVYQRSLSSMTDEDRRVEAQHEYLFARTLDGRYASEVVKDFNESEERWMMAFRQAYTRAMVTRIKESLGL